MAYDSAASLVADLVRGSEVHRDVYTSHEVYRLEMRHLFSNAWIFRRPRKPDTKQRRLFHHPDRRSAGHSGAPQDGRNPRPLQSLPAQGHQNRHRPTGQHRQVFPLPLSCVELQDRRLFARDPAEEGV